MIDSERAPGAHAAPGAAAAAAAESRRVVRGAAVASLAVMGSRVLGLVREQIFAFFFGASREYDAFLTAFRIPNLLRDLLAEGALSAAFVTTFVRSLQAHGKARAFALANLVLGALLPVLGAVVALGIWAAPRIVAAVAVGFAPDKAALATTLTRIMFPYIFAVAVAAVAMGMLNAQGLYGVPQSASSFFNITSICVGLGSAWLAAPAYMLGLWRHAAAAADPAAAARAMAGMAVGTLCGGVAQCAVQLPSLRATGFRLAPRIDWRDPEFRAVLRLMGPAVVGAAAVQLNVFVNSNFASTLGDRPISWLNYAFRLMQFPIGVFGVAVMTAAVPAMARHAQARDDAAFGATLTQALELVMLLTLPSAATLVALGEPVMRLIYEHGRFTPADTAATAAALAAYACGLPGYAAIKLVQPAFVAQGDARTPMLVSLAAVAANAALNYYLVRACGLGHIGLAASTAAMATANVLALVLVLETRRPTLARRRLLGQIARMAAATVALAAVLAGGYARLQATSLAQGSRGALCELALLLPLGGAAYVLAARLLRVEALAAAWAQVAARRARR